MAWSVLMDRKRSRAKSNFRGPSESNVLYAFRTHSRSLASQPSCVFAWRGTKPRFDASASSRRSMGDRNGDRLPSAAAIVNASSRHPSKHAASTTSFPRRASTGRRARSAPSSVSCSSSSAASRAVSAPMATSPDAARATAAGSGGSGSAAQASAAVRPGTTPSGKALSRSTSCSRATRRTSGSACASSGASRGNRCTARPGRTRPARPRRCFADAADT
mmetsp:Transcript_12488/g.42494  ORF Transcript_12488/g.42494 Transcript_12488/m.42494 type:complete len:219 (-) Transcript_12488:322-978(-)